MKSKSIKLIGSLFLSVVLACMIGACGSASTDSDTDSESAEATTEAQEEAQNADLDAETEEITCGDMTLRIPASYEAEEIEAMEGIHDRCALVDVDTESVIQLYYIDKDETGLTINDMINNVKDAGVNPIVHYDEEEGIANISFMQDDKYHELKLQEHGSRIYYMELTCRSPISQEDLDSVIGEATFE